MSEKTITRVELAEAVYNSVGLSRVESQRFVEVVLEEITVAIEQGENVKLSGFGTFLVREKYERMGRNPKTGEEAIITPRRVLSFKASNLLKARMNGEEFKGND